MTLDLFLREKHQYVTEGYTLQVDKQVKDLIELTKEPNINVLEIGFNAGHSAEIFLSNNPSLKLTSVDIGDHSYTKTGKEYIDKIYPNRHLLMIGNSLNVVPSISSIINTKYDVIFIDGGHDYYTALNDLNNCISLAHKDTIVIVDDTVYTPELKLYWNNGPSAAWLEMLRNKKVEEINRIEYYTGRGMTYGKYIIN